MMRFSVRWLAVACAGSWLTAAAIAASEPAPPAATPPAIAQRESAGEAGHAVGVRSVQTGATAPGSQVSLPSTAQAGDLIFREGTEPVSDAVMAVDGGQFSHVGMLIGGPGNWQVVHATPSEVPGRPDGVVRDTLDFFIDARRARRYAVFHVQADAAAHRKAILAAQRMLGTPFRVADTTGTYCTVLVWDAWRRAGVDLDVPFTHLNLPLLNGEYLLPGVLMASKKLRPL